MTQWDVFSSNPLEGNSLAVFPDARGLSDTEMQALAKEMNLSETTFVFRRDSATERERGVLKACRSAQTQREQSSAVRPGRQFENAHGSVGAKGCSRKSGECAVAHGPVSLT